MFGRSAMVRRRPVFRTVARARFGLLLAALLSLPLGPAAPVLAAGPCQSTVDTATVLPSPEAGRNASLPAPFNAGSWNGDRAQLLVDTQQRVGRELEGLDAPRCYADRLPAIAARISSSKL